jgi:hypothetical protein
MKAKIAAEKEQIRKPKQAKKHQALGMYAPRA